MMISKKRGVLISGGGSWGAYGAGTLTRINKDYNTVVGISTGALMSPFVALKQWDYLKYAYTSITTKNIIDSVWYKPMPLSKKGKIRKLPIIISLLLGQNTISTSKSLKKTIDNFFKPEQYEELLKENKEIIVGVQNYAQTPSQIHYFSNLNESFEDFKFWMWGSANFPFFTSLIKKNWKDSRGNFHVGLWGDGGLTSLTGINQLKRDNYKEIDIILHRTKPEIKLEGNKIQNLMKNVTTTINAMRYDIEFEYFYKEISNLNKQGVKVTVYWLPRKLEKNSMVFNQESMHYWFDEGYQTAFDENRIEVFEPYREF